MIGALNPIAARYPDLGEVDASLPIEHIQLLLQRTPERQAAFDAQVEALHTKGSSSYHQWLTPEVVGSEFGPSQADIATIVSYLKSEGFTVTNTGKSGLYIDFSGTAAQVEHTFQTRVHSFQVPGHSEVTYSAVQQASIPAALSPAIVGLVSLSNIPTAHPDIRKRVTPAPEANLPTGVGLSEVQPNDTVSTTNYAVGPQDFYTIYNENALLSATTPINGTGVTVAVLEESAVTTTDVATFRTTYNVLPHTPVSLDFDSGYGSNTCTTPAKLNKEADDEEDEALIDIEWAGAAAPGANLIFMQCASASIAGIFLSAEAVIDNNLADTMSLSYGQFEGYSPTTDTLALDLWEQAASQGETVVVSAGDSGAATEDGNYGDTYAKYGVTASSFSTTPWNVSAGGTDFIDTVDGLVSGSSNYQITNFWNTTNGTGDSSAKSYVPEMTWNDTCGSSVYSYEYYKAVEANPATFCGSQRATNNIAAGGGAPSTLYTRPSWQTATVYGLPTTTAYPQRLQPDVSLFASNGFWYHDLPLYESDANPATSYAGGTSFVAPQLAGIFALINQATGQRQGQPDYVLYSMAGIEYGTTTATNNCYSSGNSSNGLTSSPSATGVPASTCIFNDITAGTSSVPCIDTGTDCYYVSGKTYGILSTSATSKTTGSPAFASNVGWDQTTGIGSLNIANLVNNWQSATSGKSFAPTVNVTSTVSTYVYGNPTAATLKAVVSGSGSFPTGSVIFSAAPTVGTVGTAALAQSSGCADAGTCTETATEAYTAAGTLQVATYTITGTYNTTNENYSTGSGTTTFSITQQTPTLTVAAASGTYENYATLTASIAFTGSGLAPNGAVTFQVAGAAAGTLTGTCTGTTTPRVCTVSYPLGALAIGTHIITATEASDINYASATNTATLTVSAAVVGIFVTNPAGSVTSFSDAGQLQSGPVTGGGIGAAIDSSNYVWSIDAAGASVSKFNDAGAFVASYSGGGISAGKAVVIDGLGNTFIVNGAGTISELSNTGTPVSATPIAAAGVISTPASLTINAAGSLWIANSGNNTVTEVIGVAAPVVAPTVSAVTNSTLGTRP